MIIPFVKAKLAFDTASFKQYYQHYKHQYANSIKIIKIVFCPHTTYTMDKAKALEKKICLEEK